MVCESLPDLVVRGELSQLWARAGRREGKGAKRRMSTAAAASGEGGQSDRGAADESEKKGDGAVSHACGRLLRLLRLRRLPATPRGATRALRDGGGCAPLAARRAFGQRPMAAFAATAAAATATLPLSSPIASSVSPVVGSASASSAPRRRCPPEHAHRPTLSDAPAGAGAAHHPAAGAAEQLEG